MSIKDDFLHKVLFPVLLIGAIFIVFAIVSGLKADSKNQTEKMGDILTVGETKIQIEYADTPEKRTQGLSGRESLSPDAGLLFLFDELGSYGFWMKDMKFPIDIVWIADTQVVGISELLQPEGANPVNVYYPPQVADRVLEVNAGFVRKNSINVGDQVNFSK